MNYIAAAIAFAAIVAGMVTLFVLGHGDMSGAVILAVTAMITALLPVLNKEKKPDA